MLFSNSAKFLSSFELNKAIVLFAFICPLTFHWSVLGYQNYILYTIA